MPFKPAVFIWQFRGQDGDGDHDYGSGTLQEDDGDLPIGHMFVKALDGVTFMANLELSPVAIDSPDGATRVALGYQSRGIGMTPWGVHHGATVGSATLEGARAGAIAAAVKGRYMVNLEDGPGFWQGGPDEVAAFLDGFARAGGAEIWICLDSRAGHVVNEQLPAWMASPLVTTYYPEVYWPDFQTSVGQAWNDCIAPLFNAGIPMAKIVPVFPGDAHPDDFKLATSAAHSGGCPGFAVWRRGTLTAETIAVIAALPEWDAPTPPPSSAPAAATQPVAEPEPEPDLPIVSSAAPREELATAYADGWSACIRAVQNAARSVPTVPAENPYR